MKKITLLFTLILSSSVMFGQVVLTEDFEAGLAVPTGWSVQDLAAPPNGEIWTVETGGEAGGFTGGNTLIYDNGGAGNYATFDSDGFGNNGTAEESTLTSPVFDCSTLTSATLTFATVYNGNYGGQGQIEAFDGTTWVNINTYATEAGGTPSTTITGNQTFDVSVLAGVSNAQIRFRFTGNWSISWSIDNISVYQCTVAAPNAATVVGPVDSATNVPINYGTTNNVGPFEWAAAATGDAADSYNISLGTNTAGDDIGNIAGFASGNSINFGWQPNTTYFWFIESVNCAGTTPSAVWSFTTEACAETANPIAAGGPSVPADAATNVMLNYNGNSLTFDWVENDPNATYTLNLGTANPPTQPFNNFENGGTITGLATSTTYFWSVDAVNCFGTTTGPVWSFTTDAALSIDENELENIFSVYPNPTKGVLNIKGAKDVDNIKIYNLLGQNVANFRGNDIQDNAIDLEELSKGLYIVKVTSGDSTQTFKITKE